MKDNALLFGSIGTVVETSEIQREAFNQAFNHVGLNWHWSQAFYRSELSILGGLKRIERYANTQGEEIDASQIHASKTRIFKEILSDSRLDPRDGVSDVIYRSKTNNVKLGLVTNTSLDNIVAILDATNGAILPSDFDFIGTIDMVTQTKPHPEIYHIALSRIIVSAGRTVAIEDTAPGLQAAVSAGLDCIAFPGENTRYQDYSKGKFEVSQLDASVIEHVFTEKRNQLT